MSGRYYEGFIVIDNVSSVFLPSLFIICCSGVSKDGKVFSDLLEKVSLTFGFFLYEKKKEYLLLSPFLSTVFLFVCVRCAFLDQWTKSTFIIPQFLHEVYV